MNKCKLCERKSDKLNEHHLIPKSRGGKETILICVDCHRQIHALFDNKMLETSLNTIKALKEDEQIVKYLKWVKKKPVRVVHKAKRSNKTKKRDRRG